MKSISIFHENKVEFVYIPQSLNQPQLTALLLTISCDIFTEDELFYVKIPRWSIFQTKKQVTFNWLDFDTIAAAVRIGWGGINFIYRQMLINNVLERNQII